MNTYLLRKNKKNYSLMRSSSFDPLNRGRSFSWRLQRCTHPAFIGYALLLSSRFSLPDFRESNPWVATTCKSLLERIKMLANLPSKIKNRSNVLRFLKTLYFFYQYWRNCCATHPSTPVSKFTCTQLTPLAVCGPATIEPCAPSC